MIHASLVRRTFIVLSATALITLPNASHAEPLNWSSPAPLNDYAALDAQHEMLSWSASDGNGILVTVYENAGGLAASRSLDGGQTWSPVFGSTVQSDRSIVDVDVVYAGASTFVITYIESAAEGNQLYSMKSTDNGLTWSAPQVIPSETLGSYIDAASDGNGNILTTARTRIYKSADSGDTWTSTGLFGSLANFQPSDESKIAYNGDGKWVHVYSDYSAGGILGDFHTLYAGISTDTGSWTKVKLQTRSAFSRDILTDIEVAASGNSIGIFGTFNLTESLGIIKSLDGGATFSTAASLGFSPIADLTVAASGDRWLALGVRPDGINGVNTLVGYVSEDGMSTWASAARPVSSVEEGYPSVAVIAPEQFVVSYGQNQKAFPEQLGPDWDIKADQFTASWADKGYVNSNAAFDIPTIVDTKVKMDTSPAGTIVAVWSASGYSDDTDVFFARSEDGGTNWSASTPLNTDFYDDGRYDGNNNIVHVGGNTWYAWFGGMYSRSTDNGITWSTPTPISLPQHDLGNPIIASNHKGILILANTMSGETTLWRSTDAGATWNNIYTGTANPHLHLVHTGGSSWIYGGDPMLLTDDDGQSWESIAPPTEFYLPFVSQLTSDHKGILMAIFTLVPFTNQPTSLTVRVARSVDNGRNWELRDIYSVPLESGLLYQVNLEARMAHITGSNWVAAWVIPNDTVNRKDWHVWSSLSENAGDTWDAAQQIGPHTAGDTSQQGISAASTKGKVVVGWHTVTEAETTTAPLGFDSDIVVTTATTDFVITPEEPGAIADPRAGVKLNFSKPASDSLSLSGAIQIPGGFAAAGKTVTVNAGGIVRVFTLDSKGRAKVGDDSFTLSVKSKKGFVPSQLAKFKVKIKKASLAASLQDEGMTDANVKDKAVVLPVNLQVDSDNCNADMHLGYTAKAGKTGKAK